MKNTILIVGFLYISISFAQQTDFYIYKNYEISKTTSQFNDEAYSAAQSSINDIINFQHPNQVTHKNLLFKKVVTDLALYEKFALSQYQDYVIENLESDEDPALFKPLGNYYLVNEDYENAARFLEMVSSESMNKKEKNRHNYKIGYAYFMNQNYDKALNPLKSVYESDAGYRGESSYMIGHILYQDKKYDQAMKYFEPLLVETEYAQKIRPYLIQIYYNDGKFEKAIQEGKELLDSNEFPEMKPEISKIIGESYFKQKKYSQALPYLETYLNSQENPDTTDYYQLGYVNYTQNKYENAVENFNKITSEDSELGQNAFYQLGNSYLKTNKKREALSAFKAASEMKYSKKVAEIANYNYAKLSFDVGNPFEATPTVIQKFIKTYPNNSNKSQMERLLIKSYLKSNQYEEAMTILSTQKGKSEELNDIHQEISYLNAMKLYNEGNYAEAVNSFNKAIELKNNKEILAKSLFWSGESHFQLGNYSEAILNFRTLESLNVNYSEKIQLPYSLGYSYLKNKQFDYAASFFEKFLLNPKEELKNDAKLRLADSYIGLNEYDDALEVYESMLDNSESDDENVMFQQANLYGLRNNNAQKIKTLEKFVTKYPNSVKLEDAYLELANAFYEKGNFEDALKYYNQIIANNKQNENFATAYLGRADCYEQLNQTEKAINEYKFIAKKYEKTEYVKRAIIGAKPLYIKQQKVKEYEAWTKSLGYSISTQEKEELVFSIAQKNFKDKNYKKTLSDLSDFESDFPLSSRTILANYYLGESFYQTKNYPEAIKNFTKVGSKPNDNQEDGLLRLSQIYLSENKKDEAFLALDALYSTTTNPNYKSFCELELMYLYAEKKQFENAELMAEKVLLNDKNSTTIKEEAKAIQARSVVNSKNEIEAKELYKKLEKSNNQSVKAESLYYKAYFLNKDKKYKESNDVIFNFVSNLSTQQYWGAKSLIIMSQNYHYLKDKYQANYTLNQVLENYKEFPDVIEEANSTKKLIE